MRVAASVIPVALICACLGSAPALAVHPESEGEEDVQAHDEEAGIGTETPEDEEAPREESITYSGIGLSRVETPYENLEPATNLDLQLGIRVPAVRWISAEINFSFTIIPGENTNPGGSGGSGLGSCPPLDPFCDPGASDGSVPRETRSQNDLQMNNIGVFAVLRSPGRFYAMGKYGYRYVNTSIEEIQESDDKSGDAWAIGGGWRWSKGLSGIELVYCEYSSHLEYYGFNIAYGFGGKRDR